MMRRFFLQATIFASWLAVTVPAASSTTVTMDVTDSTTTAATTANTGRRIRRLARPPALQTNRTTTTADPFERLKQYKEQKNKERPARKNRMKERRIKAQEFLDRIRPQPDNVEPVSKEQMNKFLATDRGLSWFGGDGAGSDAYSSGVLADPSQEYDKWAQAYRMLGGFIDCDHDKDGDDDHNSGDNNNNNNNDYGGDDASACSRWMLWAAYVNPNYQGNGYYEYFGDSPTSKLDCHNPDSDWQLLGVYRQEFYQFIEQISKHLWAIDEYEYIVALAGLAYMTDYDCFQVGNDNSGDAIYAGVAPQPYGKFQMALYTDQYCLTPNENLGKNFDDYGLTSDIDLGSKDATDDDSYSWAYDDWYDTQEYTLTNLNDVYEEFKYCTSCVDYPTYQDGYFIGDDGTDDDDLINQCWKFYSHDSFTCEAECIAMAHAQGTILSVSYGDTMFGKTSANFYQHSSGDDQKSMESPMAKLLANAFLTLSFILFVATFLAFAVARRSRYRESRSAKSRRLLDEDRSRRSRRSSKGRRSSSSRHKEGDGIFKGSSSPSRSKSRSKRASSSSKRRSKSSGGGGSYEAPQVGSRNSKDYF